MEPPAVLGFLLEKTHSIHMMTIALLVAGLGLLVLGAELLVRGASRLAASVGVSQLVIGLTVVSYGTSTPELAVSLQAGLAGNADIAVANVVGSNIFNVLFILGACAAMKPLVVHRQLVRLEVPIMIAASVLLMALSWDGKLGSWDGALLFLGITVYSVWAIRRSRREEALAAASGDPGSAAFEARQKASRRIAAPIGYVLAGLTFLVLGARWLVNSAIQLAAAMGVSDVVIGLTIVAAGTSLPEVFTSLVATLRGERDIAIGNAVGSNIFNILMILGVSSLVTPGGLNVAPSMINFDMEVMLAVAIACLPVFFTGYSIARWEGWLFLGCYAAYAAYLIMDATGHDALPAFSHVMRAFVLPLLGVTICVIALRSLRRRGSGNIRASKS
jgi:cation:H+ antiporter